MADLGRAALKKATSCGENGETTKKSAPKPETNGVQEMPAQNGQPQPIPTAMPPDLGSTANIEIANTAPIPLGADMTGIGNNLSATMGLDPSISPDWLNFDTAFENFDAVLGSSGADVSMELLRPFNFDDFGSYGFTT